MKSNIALIGPRGAGKSRLSRKLGRLLGKSVFSIDTLISYEAGGITISEIVKQEGWRAFREREFEVLKKVCGMNGVIIDCGGGILVEAPDGEGTVETFSERKAALLSRSASIIYVKRDLEWLLKKVKRDSGRPDLIGDYEEVLQRRFPWYESVADFTLDMSTLDTEEALVRLQGYVQGE
jgi:shikimate kinase